MSFEDTSLFDASSATFLEMPTLLTVSKTNISLLKIIESSAGRHVVSAVTSSDVGQIFVQYAGGKMEHYELQESDLGAETLVKVGTFFMNDDVQSLCISDGMVGALVSCNGLGISLYYFDGKTNSLKVHWKITSCEKNTKCFGITSHDTNLITMAICDRVLMVRYITSESDVKHTPVSSIKPEEIERCKISGLCCSPDGVVYASDQGSRKIYRIETNTGNCYSFGMNHLGNPNDVALWGDFLLVLDSTHLVIFTPMGILIKKFPLDISEPQTVSVMNKRILITGIAGDLHVLEISTI